MHFSLHRKTESKINFEQFKVALKLCAEMKYGSKEKVGELIKIICGGGTSGATVSSLDLL